MLYIQLFGLEVYILWCTQQLNSSGFSLHSVHIQGIGKKISEIF